MKHLVSFSGGAGSWMAARRVVERYGVEDVSLVFTDTLIEDPDLYRFLHEAAADVGAPLIILKEGRKPWEVFHDERFIGNHQHDPCSKILKRQLYRKYLAEHFAPDEVITYLGIDWTEGHRWHPERWTPWRVEAPLQDPPYLDKGQLLEAMRARGIEPPRLYALGFPHNNCGGFCVKAGQAHFKLLLEKLPEVYAHHEEQEQRWQQEIGKPNTILRDRRGGKSKPLSLKSFRERLIAGGEYDPHEWGGCGCFSPSGED